MVSEWAYTLKGIPLSHEALDDFGPTVVFAPHADDETLACGGLIALLRRRKQRVAILVVSDSGDYMRKAETLDALGVLGISPEDTHFLGYPHGKLSDTALEDFEGLVETMRQRLGTFAPSTVVLPFRGEGQADHCTTWYVARAASRELYPHPRMLEYPLCIGPETEDIVKRDTPIVWKLDISPVLSEKQRAVAAHRSQFGDVVHDHERLLANFLRDYEGYLEFRG